MATVSVLFPPPEAAGAGKLKVKVDYTIDFEPAELGKPHQVAIQLLGEDLAGDDNPPKPFQQPRVLYTFPFGLWSHKTITPTGTITESVEAVIAEDKLDEDPGFDMKQIDPGTVIPIPHADEVFARVRVSRVAEDRSPAQTLFA